LIDLAAGKFYDLFSACPMLEVVKLHKCPGIHLHHVQYLLHHTRHVERIFVYFTSHIVADIQYRNIEADEDQALWFFYEVFELDEYSC